MSGKNRYYSAYPTINPGYLSGATGRQGNTFTFEDIVNPTVNSKKSNINVLANDTYDVFKTLKNVAEPIEVSNFNIIKLSIDTDLKNSGSANINPDDISIFVDVMEGHNPNNMVLSYSTPITTQSVFYKNYPVRNKFCNVKFRNNQGSNIHLDYEVSLSKFTQMNPPVQIGDNVEFSAMSNLTRAGNEYYDDVSRNKFANSSLVNRFGYFTNNVSSTQVVSPVNIQTNTSNTYTEVFGISDSALDAFEFTINGETDGFSTLREANGIQLLGTSNGTVSINRYKYIDTVDLPQTNKGNITIFKTGTSEPVAFIPKGFANVSSPLFFINTIEEGVLKEIRVKGRTILQNGQINVKLIQGINEKTIWTTSVMDGVVENVFTPDLLIPSNSTVYAEVENINTTAYTEQRVDVILKIVKYELKPITSLQN